MELTNLINVINLTTHNLITLFNSGGYGGGGYYGGR